MNKERLLSIVLAPVVSEKSTVCAELSNRFVFKVAKDATKPEIKKAISLLFDVDVESVSTSNVKGKRKRFGAIQGRRANWKKAFVKLKSGQDIDFSLT